MSVEDTAANINTALAGMATARNLLIQAAAQLEESQRLVEHALWGTRDWEAGQIPGRYEEARENIARIYAQLQTLETTLSGHLHSIGATRAVAAPTARRPADNPSRPTSRTTAPSPHVSPERVAELRRELPPDVQPPSQRPRGAPKPKTHGRWIGPDGTRHTEVSGDDNKTRDAVDWFKSQGIDIPQRISDVEMKLAVHMRLSNIKEVTLVINHVPCPGIFGCDSMVPRILPPGYTMTVHGAKGFSKTYRGEGDA